MPAVAEPIKCTLVSTNNVSLICTVDRINNASASFIFELLKSEEFKNINSMASKPFKREIISFTDLMPLSTITFIS